MKTGFAYIMSNVSRTVFYTGVTNNIEKRCLQHKKGIGGVFTSKYKCFYLVYYESFWEIVAAIQREKEIKNRRRKWKIDLIKSTNPEMKDLSVDWDLEQESHEL